MTYNSENDPLNPPAPYAPAKPESYTPPAAPPQVHESPYRVNPDAAAYAPPPAAYTSPAAYPGHPAHSPAGYGAYPPPYAPRPLYNPALLAQPLSRLLAQLIDSVVIVAMMFLGVMGAVFGFTAAGNIGNSVSGFFFILFAVICILAAIGLPLLYEIVLVARTGQTWGKKALGIKVVRIDGAPVTYKTSSARAFARFGLGVANSIVGFASLLDAAWLLWDPQRQTIHDKAAATVVVNS